MRYYQDVSHFRAPYKNVPVGGLGGIVYQNGRRVGFGAVDEMPPPPGPMTEDDVNKLIVRGDDGLWRFRPDAADIIKRALAVYGAIFTNLPTDPSLPAVLTAKYTTEEIGIAKQSKDAALSLYQRSAIKWMQDQIDAGRIVFANVALFTGQPGTNVMWSVGRDDKERLSAYAASPMQRMTPILADPRDTSILKKAMMSPVVIGLVAAGVAGTVLLLVTRKKRRARAEYTGEAYD